MATPKDNTEVVRILQDYKKAIFKSNSPFLSPPRFSRNLPAVGRQNKNYDLTTVAAHLNFTNLDDTGKFSDSISFRSSDSLSDPLKRKLVTTEVDLLASKAALKEKETMMSLMEPANKKICLDLEQKLELSMKQIEIDQETIADLKTRLKFAQNETLFEKSRADECEKEKRLECNKVQMQILAVQKECGNLKLELADVRSERAETIRKLKSEIGMLELKLSSTNEESNVSKEVIQSLKKQVEELTEKATESIQLQEDLHEAQLRIKSLENKIAADEDANLIVKSMQSELKSLPELKKENRSLREEVNKYRDSNINLLQEKFKSAEDKLAQYEKERAQLTNLEFENDMLKSKIQEWEKLCSDHSPSSSTITPIAFSRRLCGYQQNELALVSKISKLTSECKNLESHDKFLSSTIEQLKRTCEESSQSRTNYENFIKNQRKKIIILTKERNNYRELIDSYTSETTLGGATLNISHIKCLEDTITDLKKSLENSDKDTESLQSQVKSLISNRTVNEKSKLEIKQLEEEKSVLASTIQELRKEISALEEKVNSATQIQTETASQEKIIHFKHNPFDVAVKKRTADFKMLQDENDRLKKRVKVLEEEGAAAMDVTAKVNDKLEKEGSDTLLQSLKDQLATSEKQNKLILETARTTSREFRQAVYSMTGYKVDNPSLGKYKLSHIYADSRDDYLYFQINEEGVHLLETDYSSQLTALIDMYLKTYDSVPAFLASVTMDLFKQQTCMLSQ